MTFRIKIQNYNDISDIILSHCYHCSIMSEPMKQPHNTLNEMHAIIKCTNHNKLELKKHCEAKVDGTANDTV